MSAAAIQLQPVPKSFDSYTIKHGASVHPLARRMMAAAPGCIVDFGLLESAIRTPGKQVMLFVNSDSAASMPVVDMGGVSAIKLPSVQAGGADEYFPVIVQKSSQGVTL